MYVYVLGLTGREFMGGFVQRRTTAIRHTRSEAGTGFLYFELWRMTADGQFDGQRFPGDDVVVDEQHPPGTFALRRSPSPGSRLGPWFRDRDEFGCIRGGSTVAPTEEGETARRAQKSQGLSTPHLSCQR